MFEHITTVSEAKAELARARNAMAKLREKTEEGIGRVTSSAVTTAGGGLAGFLRAARPKLHEKLPLPADVVAGGALLAIGLGDGGGKHNDRVLELANGTLAGSAALEVFKASSLMFG